MRLEVTARDARVAIRGWEFAQLGDFLTDCLLAVVGQLSKGLERLTDFLLFRSRQRLELLRTDGRILALLGRELIVVRDRLFKLLLFRFR